MSKVLMCPPEHYQVLYEINPWMNVRRPADTILAKRQWDDFYRLLKDTLHIEVLLLDPVPKLPDMVFTANAALVYGKRVIRSSFRHPERAKEEPHYDIWFRKNGYEIKTLEGPLKFEGEGDALFLGNELLMGYHFRSDVEAHDAVAGLLKKNYSALELRDKRFYHLDTCMAPLDARSALIFLEAFEPYAQLALLEHVQDPIRVSEAEAMKFVCNAFVFQKQVVLPSGCPRISSELQSRGFTVHELDFSEFIKAGGGPKCLTLWLEK